GRESAAEQVKLSEQRYRQLFENAHDAIWVQDLSGTITAANEATADVFGYGLSELLGTDIKHVLPVQGLKIAKDLQNRLLRGEQTRQPYTQKLIRKDGMEIVLRLTTNLISSNGHASGLQFIGRDITNELRMQENQQFYLEQITKAHEDERLRISRDLHDSTAQNLIAAINQLEDFCHTDQYLPMPKLQVLLGLYEQLKDVLREIRQVSRDLRPSIIDDLGILPAVEWLTEQVASDYKIETSLDIIGDERRFSPEIEVTVFRIVQEALRNVVKHANATKAGVTIEFKEAETIVKVADNGKGFALPNSLGEFSREGKLGVDGMLTRAKLVGGTLDIDSKAGLGTTLTVTIPV
ncbi:MAG: PAS domain S-box protein, partial [Actinomycetota bacterium]|nr:PAS domain S-box protein [Actinomycetota bacterium]